MNTPAVASVLLALGLLPYREFLLGAPDKGWPKVVLLLLVPDRKAYKIVGFRAFKLPLKGGVEQGRAGQGRAGQGAFTGYVPQIVPDKVPNTFHSIMFSKLFLCFRVFFCQLARGRRPTLTLTLTVTLTPTLPQASASTRARLRRACWKN